MGNKETKEIICTGKEDMDKGAKGQRTIEPERQHCIITERL